LIPSPATHKAWKKGDISNHDIQLWAVDYLKWLGVRTIHAGYKRGQHDSATFAEFVKECDRFVILVEDPNANAANQLLPISSFSLDFCRYGLDKYSVFLSELLHKDWKRRNGLADNLDVNEKRKTGRKRSGAPQSKTLPKAVPKKTLGEVMVDLTQENIRPDQPYDGPVQTVGMFGNPLAQPPAEPCAEPSNVKGDEVDNARLAASSFVPITALEPAVLSRDRVAVLVNGTWKPATIKTVGSTRTGLVYDRGGTEQSETSWWADSRNYRARWLHVERPPVVPEVTGPGKRVRKSTHA
jgi:hypothetical protein